MLWYITMQNPPIVSNSINASKIAFRRFCAVLYTTCIRAVVECNTCVLPFPSSELIRLEKRALSTIIPGEDYKTATNKLEVKPLQIHHEHLNDEQLMNFSMLLSLIHRIRCIKASQIITT